MNKEKLEFIGAEILVMLVCCVAAGIAFAVQLIARELVAESDVSLFYGCAYSYNPVAYTAGWLLYGGCLAAAFKFFTGRFKIPKDSGTGFKILGVFFAVILTAGTFLGLIFEAFMFLGLTDDMRPEFLFYISGFGMPAVALGLMVYNVLRRERA